MPNARARYLRSNSTDAERRLWSRLRFRQLDGHRFRRQAPIGRYIVDFVCLAKRLVVEVDGGQYADDIAADARRTAWLKIQGYRVPRLWNNEVLGNIDGVLSVIRSALCSEDDPPPR